MESVLFLVRSNFLKFVRLDRFKFVILFPCAMIASKLGKFIKSSKDEIPLELKESAVIEAASCMLISPSEFKSAFASPNPSSSVSIVL